MDTNLTRMLIGAVALVAAAFAMGCATPNNDRLSLGTSAQPVVALPAIEPGAALTEATGPSVTSLDRSGWTRVGFVVPNDATEHYPHFTRLQPRYDKGTARARGEYPTVLTALEQEGDFGSIFAESIAWPVYVPMDAVMIIPRAVDPAQDSPMTHYERAPEEQGGTDPRTVANAAPKSTSPAPKAKRSKKPRNIGPARW